MKLPRRDGLNLIPFIDIMLVLLAIVLSISTFIVQGKIKVNLPEAQTNIKKEDESKIILTVDENNNFYIDDEMMDIDEVRHYLLKLNSRTLVELRSDSDAKFSSFIKIIDILKEKDHENFSIQTRTKN